MERILSSVASRILEPLKIIFPDVYSNCFTGKSFVIDNAVRDFPLPDSPTRAKISPSLSVKEIFCNTGKTGLA